MFFRFSRLDLGPIIRKQRSLKKPHVVKREVFEHDLILSRKQAEAYDLGWEKKVVPLLPVIVREPINPFRLLPFTLSLIIVAVLTWGVSYLSSAHKASGIILGAATSAYEDLNSASQRLSQQSFENAASLFESAGNSLLMARTRLDEFKPLTYLVSQAKNTDNILQGAYLLSSAGESLISALAMFDELKVSSQGVETESFTEKLAAHKTLLSNSLGLLKQAEVYFQDTNGLPDGYQAVVSEGKKQLSQLNLILNNFISLEDLYISFFGSEAKTYLLLFQNYDEQRATGGFIGTYGVLRVEGGKIKKLKIESVYELDGSLNSNIAAPGPMQPDIRTWGLRDANWFIDFPASAKKLLYFFEKGAETADGVIVINPTVFEQLLKLVGPVVMEQYDVVLTPTNFQDVVQDKTSIDYNRALNQPKKFLADFAPILLNRFMNLDQAQWFSFFEIVNTSLKKRDILLYSKDQQTQEKIENLGFVGRALATDHDYLMIVHTNLGGTKTDLDMVSKVHLITKILSDGTAINYLQIRRKNVSNEPNRNYLRILVPEGSELISADGVASLPHHKSEAEGLVTDPDLQAWDQGELKWDRVFVRKEADKTEFAAWVLTDPDSESEVNFAYVLPFKIKTGLLRSIAPISALVQKQPGSLPYEFIHEIYLDDYMAKWLSPNVKDLGSRIEYTSHTAYDDYWAAVLAHE